MLPSRPSKVFLCKAIGNRWQEKIAQSTDRLDGTVLNVFEKAINIKMDGDELLVLSLARIPSPITINIASEQDPKQNSVERRDSILELVAPGDHVSMMRRMGESGSNVTEISLGNAFILAEKPDYFKNNVEQFDENSLRSFSCYDKDLFFLLTECANSDRKGCLLNPDMTTKGLLPEFLAQIYNGSDTFDIANPGGDVRLCSALLGLCGRGPGFTPAGDDFISGFITMFNIIRSSLNIGPAIIPGPEFAHLTSWTSFKLMEYNAMGMVDIQIQELINSAAQGNILLYAEKIRLLSKRGHTSGLDFSTGSTFALCMAADSIINRSRNGDPSKLVSLARERNNYQRI